MAKDYIYDLHEILKCCDDQDTKLKFYDYVIDEMGIDDYYYYIERASIYDEIHKYRHALRDYREAITHATVIVIRHIYLAKCPKCITN